MKMKIKQNRTLKMLTDGRPQMVYKSDRKDAK